MIINKFSIIFIKLIFAAQKTNNKAKTVIKGDYMKNNKCRYYFAGLAAGILNGLFGSGGGLVLVPLIEKNCADPKRAHACSVMIILMLSIASAFVYYANASLDISQAVKYIPFGIAGALIGSFALKKISGDILRRIFGAVIVFSAIRMLMR